MAENGSIQNIDEIPDNIKELYKTVWEISQKAIIDMAADRGAFICQSQSLNLFISNPNFAKLSSMHFYGWKKGLKTGMYYLRSKSAVDAIKFTVDKTAIAKPKDGNQDESTENASVTINRADILLEQQQKEKDFDEQISCSLDNPDDCEMCGS